MSEMSGTAPCYGVHEFLNLSDVTAVFGHGADYILCSRRSLIAHTEKTGVSVVVETVRMKSKPPCWCQTNNVQRHIDCLWPAINELTMSNAVEKLFCKFDAVWLVRGSGCAWFRGYSYDSEEWEDSIIRWPEKSLPLHPGPREARLGWLRSCGSDATEACSAIGLPIVHLWEAVEWTESFSAAISERWNLHFRTDCDGSNWTYKFGEYEFLSWQNAPSSVDCPSIAAFSLDHAMLMLLRSLLDWAAESTDTNPLICRASMRDANTLRLVTAGPRRGRAIDFLLAI